MTSLPWQTKCFPAQPTDVAPDGSDVRVLLGVAGGGMAHFELGPGETSIAVVHRTIDEVWFFLEGRGEMWRSNGENEETVEVGPGTCITIPVGTRFQFRSFGFQPLAALGATMPPWPGEGEAARTEGPWTPTVTGTPR